MTAQEATTTSKDAKGAPDLRNLQDRFRSLLDQRDEYNDLSRNARQERDLLNEQRRTKAKEIDEARTARDAANDVMRKHKELRNAFQEQAKALIGEKKGKTGSLERSLPLRVRKLRNELQAAIEQQQTTNLTVTKEKVLVEKIRDMWLELKELEKELEKQTAVEVDLSDTDQAIDQLFAKADEEHENVLATMKQAQEHHEKFVAAVKEIRILAGESDKKHNEFIAYKKKADEVHHKAMELREKVMAIRGERKAEYEARRAEMRDVNDRVRRNVMDPKAIEKAKESQLEQLKKGGKINLGF